MMEAVNMKLTKESNFLFQLMKSPSRLGSVSDDQSLGQEGFSNDDGEGGGSSRGCLLFEYLE